MYAFMLKPPEAMKPQHDKTFEKKKLQGHGTNRQKQSQTLQLMD